MSIIGININVAVAAGSWSSTDDPIYLGVYGKNGGREFALQVGGNSPFTNDGSKVQLVLGSPCCEKENSGLLQVDNSQGLKENDPLLNPLEIDDIEFVYLRKYAGKTASTDDWCELKEVSILFCNSKGKLKRFRKTGRLHFSKESGQKHYLKKTSPPGCRVTIKLNEIHHKDMAKKPAGNMWKLNWWCIVPGANTPAIEVGSYSEKINLKKEPDEWKRFPFFEESFIVEGCCGSVPIFIMTRSMEKDNFFNANDVGSGSKSFFMDCSVPNNSTEVEIENYVNGSLSNKKSKITYSFKVTTECLG